MFYLMYSISGVFVLLSGFYFYVYFRRAAELFGLRVQSRAGKAVLAVLTAVFVLPAVNVWDVWVVVVLHLLAFALLMELANVIVKRAGRNGKIWNRLYRSGVLPVLCVVTVIGYGWWNMHHVIRTDYTVYTQKPIRSEGYRIGLLSDLHYGAVQSAEELTRICEQISEAKPDLVVLCGDIVDERTTKAEMQEAFAILSGIQTNYGIYYVYGNHDRGRYVKKPHFTEKELEHAIADNGIRALRDEVQVIEGGLTLLGREDRKMAKSGGRKSPEELLELADPLSYLLLLDHQPQELAENAGAGYDLQLSGHTHGGQIWPVGEISGLLGFGDLNYGQERIGSFEAIVTSGLAGWNYPLRTGKHSEYVMVELLAKFQPGG